MAAAVTKAERDKGYFGFKSDILPSHVSRCTYTVIDPNNFFIKII